MSITSWLINTKENPYLNHAGFFKEKEILIRNILPVVTDGAPAMTEPHKGFIKHFKQAVTNVLAVRVHCVIHRQQLPAIILLNACLSRTTLFVLRY